MSFATNVIDFTVPEGGFIEFQLFHNGSVVPGFTTNYDPGDTGVKTALAPVPETFLPGDTFWVRVFTVEFTGDFMVTATIGVVG